MRIKGRNSKKGEYVKRMVVEGFEQVQTKQPNRPIKGNNKPVLGGN